jgi:hypothetical protein
LLAGFHGNCFSVNTYRLATTQRSLSMLGARAGRETHPRLRPAPHHHLVAGLEIATGHFAGVCNPHHRHQEFLIFLRHLARAYPVKAWLAANPRIHTHFTATPGSWLNLVGVWFSIIERQAIHRGAYPSRPRPHDQGPGLDQRMERPLPTVRLDKDRRPNPTKPTVK